MGVPGRSVVVLLVVLLVILPIVLLVALLAILVVFVVFAIITVFLPSVDVDDLYKQLADELVILLITRVR